METDDKQIQLARLSVFLLFPHSTEDEEGSSNNECLQSGGRHDSVSHLLERHPVAASLRLHEQHSIRLREKAT